MQVPLQISFRNMEPSERLSAQIREKVAKLEKVSERILGCRVVVEAPQKRPHHGGHFHTRIDITLPQEVMVINREPDAHHSYEDVNVSIRDAFDTAKRLLRKTVDLRQGKVKTHEVPLHGHISALSKSEGHGRITTPDGGDLYFHKNSLINADFDSLELGAEVRFAEELGDNGPQATTVTLCGKHHLVG